MRLNRRDFTRLALSAFLLPTSARIVLYPDHDQAIPDYRPKFRKQWDEVYKCIQENWKLDLVRDPKLPRSFLSESPGWNFMFYWDNYFMNLGLLQLPGYESFAKDATDNLLALVDQHGFVPNCDLPWGDHRSQPPYLSLMVRDVYNSKPDKRWLRRAQKTLLLEYEFWTDHATAPLERHDTRFAPLVRYSQHATFEEKLDFYNGQWHDRFGSPLGIPNTDKIKVATHAMAEAETGMDFNTRFEHRTDEFAAVDLNVLLYLYERNFAWMKKELAIDSGRDWNLLADRRANAIQRYMWDPNRGFYYDFDFVNRRLSSIACCTGFMPLWAGIATPAQTSSCVKTLAHFEREWGVATCEPSQHDHVYQWDFPVCWPPHVQLVLLALRAAGRTANARQIASKFLDLVTRNFQSPVSSNQLPDHKSVPRQPGHLYEKYEVIDGTIADTEYPAFQGNAWTAGVFVCAYQFVLSEEAKRPNATI